MAFLRSPQPEDYLDAVRGRTIVLRPPMTSDYEAWAELRALSRTHLTPWEPSWAPDELSRGSFRRRLKAYARDVRDDIAYAFFITDGASDVLLGGITLSNVRRGVAQMATLGYWIGMPYARKGRMQEAVETISQFGFRRLHLHRIEAACMPANIASIGVLEKCGFAPEGVARQYLKINGTWEDHILFARLSTCAGLGWPSPEARR